MIRYGDYTPTKKEWDYYTKIKLTKIQKVMKYLFDFNFWWKHKMYNKLKKTGIKRKELD